MPEIVLGGRARVVCREGKDGRGNGHGDKRARTRDRQRSVVRRGRYKSSKIANAKGNALRLRELERRNYFSCARSGIFMGTRGVPSDCSCETTVVGASLARVSSWGHEIGPSACSSK